ncbi:transcription elongation factor GreA [Candidatus Dojkabacteria bacterium]|uniref:Transcription elongation factor GreA n=1 Tax=Candidatus Dojkabacteria bacterium TaxID=2099670 RepID=A0A847VCV1_9BACT|nr:transcription elongation factor GreA [Candidatus Dojkabacteria bacterium]
MVVKKRSILLTEEGIKTLERDLAYREGELRAKLQDTLNQMRSQGDLRENDGYTIAVTDFQNNEERILEIKEKLENAEVISNSKTSSVDIGSKVTIECEKGLKNTYHIVGEEETNPIEAKISYKSPIGSSLFGAKKGSTVTITTPAGENRCKIIKIE